MLTGSLHILVEIVNDTILSYSISWKAKNCRLNISEGTSRTSSRQDNHKAFSHINAFCLNHSAQVHSMGSMGLDLCFFISRYMMVSVVFTNGIDL